MSDLVFRKIHGRIVPIKNTIKTAEQVKNSVKKTDKNDLPAIAQVGAGFGVAGAGGVYAGNLLRKSWNAYRSSAHIRGSIKEILSIRPSMRPDSLYREASAFKVAGKALANRGFGVLAVSGLVGSSLAGYGAYKYLRKKNKVDENKAFAIASTAGAIASGAGIALFAKKAKIKHIVSALKATGKVSVSDLSKAWSTYGEARTRATIKKYADIASSGASRNAYSANINKTTEQLKKLARKKAKGMEGQMSLF